MSTRSNAVIGSLAVLLGACEAQGTVIESDAPNPNQNAITTPVEMSESALLSETEAAAAEGADVSGYTRGMGAAETVHTSGTIDRNNPFFQALGANLRTCETCHAAEQGWTITARATTRLFLETAGTAPLFMVHDAGSRIDADISTLAARWETFGSTLAARGLIRFTRNISPTAEYLIASVNDPYGWSTPTSLSAFRRPSPTANESKVAHTGWAGAPGDPFVSVFNTSGGATRGHEQRVDPLPVEVQSAMRDFQLGVVFAQSVDPVAGRLTDNGAKGGAANLMAQPFYVGINDIQGNDPQRPFSRKVFDIFDSWVAYKDVSPLRDRKGAARGAIYRGQELFNNFEFNVSGVPGLNDLLGQEVVRATCSTCHNAPNVGSHSVYRMFDIGTADEVNCSDDLPLLTVQNKATGATRKVCDLGRGTSSGLWTDIGRFRAPPLRGLAARAPYFHDGQARDLREVVRYFDRRFSMNLNLRQRADLEAFLSAL
jgi:cytochrome c peroxidase